MWGGRIVSDAVDLPSSSATPAADGDRRSDGCALLRLTGEIDLTGCQKLDAVLRESAGRLVLDVSEVEVFSGAAIGLLIAHAERLDRLGGRLLVVAGTDAVRRNLWLAHAGDVLDVYDSVADALQAIEAGAPNGPNPDRVDDGVRRLPLHRGETFRLRRQLRTLPTVARAIGVLQERYSIGDDTAAFDVLRTSSQRHNLRLNRVAAAVLAAPAPRRSSGESWFPGRRHLPAPELPFVADEVARAGNRSAVLDAVLVEMAGRSGTGLADLQVPDVRDGQLQLERHRGLSQELVELVDTADYAGTAPAQALHRRERVAVDVTDDPAFDGSLVRAMLLAGGIRMLRSLPLLGPADRVAGVVTTHHAERVESPDPSLSDTLARMAAQTGAWLDWHQRTVVLDALEEVHRSARQR
jgi:anti-anti-sigma factor